jgi:hypothetical protein
LRRIAIASSSWPTWPVGGLWGLDELVRGTNPARRVLGLGAMGVQSVRAALRR